MKLDFYSKKDRLKEQFNNIEWIEGSGLDCAELEAEIKKIEAQYPSRAVAKAKTFELILTKGKIATDKEDIFQDKLIGRGIMLAQRERWQKEITDKFLKEETEEMDRCCNEYGAYHGIADFGHTSPNSRALVKLGFKGLLDRVNEAAKKEGLTEKQKNFYLSCRTVLEAYIAFTLRLAEAIAPYNADSAEALENIANGAPKSVYEAMQLIIIYFFMHEDIAGTRARTLGRLDLLLYPLYKEDIASGRYTKEEEAEILRYFLYKFYSREVDYGLPFCIGGSDTDGREVTNEYSYLIVEVFDELNIHSPKIHVRVSDKTPRDFTERVLRAIRGGNSSFVFMNDAVVIKSLMSVGISEKDALDYLPIGCYEPAVWGKEIGCTGGGMVNFGKAVELVFTRGKDYMSGEKIGVDTGVIDTYEEFLSALKKQVAYMTERSLDYVRKIEKYYSEINPDPILSGQYDDSIERGIDVYEGGAKYNNGSLYGYCIGSFADSVVAVKKLVFDEKICTFERLGEILKNNWQGEEKLRNKALAMKEKYGNGNAEADNIAKEFSAFFASLVNNQPNSRGGVFKASNFSIHNCFTVGKRTMATPDGRLCGEPLSKNLGATSGMDRNGVTALIKSATEIDHSLFPNGSVLDVVVHPSAVSGEDGLAAFHSLLDIYFARGGMAMHGNVFSAEKLKDAQKNPAKYKNLQVRVCGWNNYFLNLPKEQQDAFIKQAENNG